MIARRRRDSDTPERTRALTSPADGRAGYLAYLRLASA